MVRVVRELAAFVNCRPQVGGNGVSQSSVALECHHLLAWEFLLLNGKGGFLASNVPCAAHQANLLTRGAVLG